MNGRPLKESDAEIISALLRTIPDSRWEAVAIAKGLNALSEGSDAAQAAAMIKDQCGMTLKKARSILEDYREGGYFDILTPRERLGSAENPITKLFPATIIETRFQEALDALVGRRSGLSYRDDRDSGSLVDFIVDEGRTSLPINVKTAGTRFFRASELVGLDPDDCLPIPAYKANAAVEQQGNLLYVISADYDLFSKLADMMPQVLDKNEMITWRMLNAFSGSRLKDAENRFVFESTAKYWDAFSRLALDAPFHVISARKALRILHNNPRRTPGIGMKGWGSGASAEVNIHVSIKEDTTPWLQVEERIIRNGTMDIIEAVNRRRTEVVYDPEI